MGTYGPGSNLFGKNELKKNSSPGSRTQLSRVTGACTNRYTSEDILACSNLREYNFKKEHLY